MRASVLVLGLFVGGCYASHEREVVVDEPPPCDEPAHATYLRNDCTTCNAIHLTWLRRCGDVWHVSNGYAVHATYAAGECGAITLESCALDGACVSPSACTDYDVASLDELLEVRATWSPRGGAEPFEPHLGDESWLMAPSCEDIIGFAPDCM